MSGIKVLIVDDEQDFIEILAEELANAGYQIESAFNGQDALDKYKQFKPDVLLTDLMMPVMNGVELIKQVSQLSHKCLIITLSAYSVREHELVKHSIYQKLQKPIKLNYLLEIMQQAERDLKTT